ncbi:MAG: lipocalin-like domain-containing protein [Prevotella sp.]
MGKTSKALLLSVMLSIGIQIHAQSFLGNIVKDVVSKTTDTTQTVTTTDQTGSIISSIANAITGNITSTKDKIVGTWIYQGPAVVMSGDNALKNIGGKIASSKMEQTLKTKLEAYGFKAGSVTMTFDDKGNFTQTLSKKTVSGTYTIDDDNIVLKYGGKVSQIAGTTQLDGNDLIIVMDVSKLLTLANTLGSMSSNTTLKTAASLIGSMDGMECGLRLTKK